MNSFRSNYTVDRRLYTRRYSYPYRVISLGKPAPPMPSAILNSMSNDSALYREEWKTAFDSALPEVAVYVGGLADENPTRHVQMLVDTGAAVSTITSETADWLGMYRYLLSGESLVPLRGASGGTIAGLARWMRVWLGGATRIIPVLVPPRDPSLLRRHGKATASAPTRDVLGRAEILENFLLCFDHEELDVFCRKSRP